MDIAAMSTMLSQAKVQQQASISVMKMAMDSTKAPVEGLNKMLEANTKIIEQAVNPHIGSHLDTKA